MRIKTVLPAIAVAMSAAGAHAESYITFQYGGAGGTTYVMGINAGGDVTGSTNRVDGTQDFIRKADGSVTFFTVPGESVFTPEAISRKGAVTGWSAVPGSDYGKAFVREPDGTTTVFTAFGFTTAPVAINAAGTIVGSYFDGAAFHGFVRTADGTLTELKGSPGASATWLSDINDKGVIAGGFTEPTFAQSFLKFPDGSQQNFTEPENGVRVNAHGWTSGGSGNGDACVRSPGGDKRKVAYHPKNWEIYLSDIGARGDVVGTLRHRAHPNSAKKNFVYSYATGTFTWLHAPGEDTDPRSYGTQPVVINESGVIAGIMYDTTAAATGFIRLP